MAKPPPPGVPQLEDGYLRLANALVDAMIRTRMLASEKDVFLLALRQAYGFHEKEAGLSVRFVVERTGYSLSTASEALRSLVEARMLEVVQERQGRTPAVYRIQKDFRLWVGYEPVPGSDDASEAKENEPEGFGTTERENHPDASALPNARPPLTLRHDRTREEPDASALPNRDASALPNDQRHGKDRDHDRSDPDRDLNQNPNRTSPPTDADWKSVIRPAALQALLRLSPGGVPLHYRNRLEQLLDSSAERERLLPSLLAAVERTVPRVAEGHVEQRNAIGYALSIAGSLMKEPLPAPAPLAHNWSHDPEGKPLRAAAASPAPPRSPWDNILA